MNDFITLEVKELGIVKDAKIDLKPFTIFFGKNNTGKTYLAYLIYGVCNVYDELWSNFVEFRGSIDLKPVEEFLRSFIEKEAKSDSFSFEINVEDWVFLISKDFVNYLFNNSVRFNEAVLKLYIPIKVKINLYVKVIKDVKNIINDFKNTFEIGPPDRIDFGYISGDTLGYCLATSFKLKEDRKKIGLNTFIGLLKGIKPDIEHIVANILSTFPTVIPKCLADRITKNVIFIPASKSGIFLLRKYIFKKSVEEMLSGKFSEDSIALPKPIIDFIKQTLIEKPTINEEFLDLVEFGEKNIVQGSVDYDPVVDEVVYRPKKGVELTPTITSALVVESIPLLTFLKYGVIKRAVWL